MAALPLLVFCIHLGSARLWGHRKQGMCDNREESAPNFPIAGAEAGLGLFHVTYDTGISLCKGYSSGPLK